MAILCGLKVLTALKLKFAPLRRSQVVPENNQELAIYNFEHSSMPQLYIGLCRGAAYYSFSIKGMCCPDCYSNSVYFIVNCKPQLPMSFKIIGRFNKHFP